MTKVVRIQSRICGGGPAVHTILLSEGLSYRKGAHYDTVLLGGELEPGESSMEALARSRGVNIEVIPEMRRAVNPWADARAVMKATQRIRALQPDVVHTHTAKAGAVGRTAARLAGAPIVVHTFHGHIFDGYFHPAKVQAFLAAERALARWTDRILVLSERQRQDLVNRYRVVPEDKVEIVPLGLDLEPYLTLDGCERGAIRQALGISNDAPVVVAAGRFVPIKRFDLLIQAFLQVLTQVPNAHLWLAGDGTPEARQALERAARPAASRIHFLGWRKDLPQLFLDADVLALTSDNEGTPVAVIEALTAGLPVVATQVGGVEDIVTPDMGTLVQPGDVHGIATALMARLHTASRLPRALRRGVGARFSHHRLVADMTRLYDRLREKKMRRVPRFERQAKGPPPHSFRKASFETSMGDIQC